MKMYRALFLALAGLALMAPGSAKADTRPGWYVGLGGMPVFQEDSDSTSDTTTDIIKYDTGWGVSGSGGYAWGNGIRTEAEIAYRRSGVDEVTGTGAAAPYEGHISNLSFMGNVLYDIETGTIVTPYVGAGIGVSAVTADEIRTVVGRTLDETRPEFAYQFIGGASVDVMDNLALTADYRYFRTTEAKFRTNADDNMATDNASHNVMVGLRYKFAPPAPVRPAPAQMAPAPVPAAPAAPRAEVPPVPQSYMVFFDFDKAILTPEAKRIIAAAAEDYKSGKYVRIVVTGHTDTMGTVKYNQKLSERRAMAVKKEFAALGVPADDVKTAGAGKSSLLVPTNDQVREAQNRRAEIVFSRQ